MQIKMYKVNRSLIKYVNHTGINTRQYIHRVGGARDREKEKMEKSQPKNKNLGRQIRLSLSASAGEPGLVPKGTKSITSLWFYVLK